MRNMKIKVENNLDEIVATLEGKGYKFDNLSNKPKEVNTILTWSDGTFDFYRTDMEGLIGPALTTLAELKDMQNAK